jgi:DNA mismatch repair protein MutL
VAEYDLAIMSRKVMGSKIRILPESLCNKIAAGEVVERPASVVKELLENSLDASATDIRIEIEGGGKRLIRVRDNGEGMGKDDLFLSLERHATSKIRSDEDFFRLCTLGFRGEALPAIASVSRLILQSRSDGADEGWEIYAEGGTVKRADPVGIPCGTMVEVRDLFFNTPARRKFLRRDETEQGHIGDIVTKLALAHPQVRFSLMHNGRPLIEVYRHAELQERIASLLGRPLVRDLIPIAAEGGHGLSLGGFIAQPAVNRSSSDAVFVYINGRYIRDRVVQHAIMEGYRSVLPKGRSPIAVLFIQIDPALVDVNVHPTKHEVRFRDQRSVHDFLAGALREALRPSGWLNGFRGEPPPVPTPVFSSLHSVPGPDSPAGDEVVSPASTVAENPEEYRLPMHQVRAPMDAGPSPAGLQEPGGFFSSLTLIGQFRRSYLLCQDHDDLVIIDQHAAHERIRFEGLRAGYRQGKIEQQALLFPAVLDFDFREAAVLGENIENLAKLGFDLEAFGGNSFVLKAIPQIFSTGDVAQLIRDVAAELVTIGKSGLIEDNFEKIFMVMACHNAVRANQALAGAEIKALFAALDGVDFGAHCPHGRPVMKRIPLADIERMFKRT